MGKGLQAPVMQKIDIDSAFLVIRVCKGMGRVVQLRYLAGPFRPVGNNSEWSDGEYPAGLHAGAQMSLLGLINVGAAQLGWRMDCECMSMQRICV